jgi:hypothetical protein
MNEMRKENKRKGRGEGGKEHTGANYICICTGYPS